MDLRILGMPFSDPEGQPFVQVILQDITGERRRQRSLQTFAAHMLQAQEEERRRIARELHDESIQSLVLLCRELDVLSAKWSEDRYALKEGIRQVRHLAEQVVEELREFTRRLRPPILEELGLAACLRRMALELGERTGISVGVSLQGCRARLPLNTELALFRIAQEALHNVERHSMATRCSIELHCTSDVVRLVVADDGQGFVFDPASIATDPDRHLGLIGMHERAQAIGGKLRVRSVPGKGTTIEVTLPVGSATKPGQRSR
jgi:signal transduction histidine kinase